MIMPTFPFPVTIPPIFIAILAFFILNAPGVFALSSLTSELHKRSPVLAIMATLSPLAVTGYSVLAIGLSYTLLRLFLVLKHRLLSSAATTALPHPVSAGRTSAFSFRSPFSSFRYRQKSTTVKPPRTRSRWSPLSAFYRRLIRPSSPLHLTEADGLPTVMPDSSSATYSFLDLPVLSRSSPITIAKSRSHIFETRQISRSSSMDALPSYKPLTPVYVQAPVISRTPSSPPSTPSPSTSKFLPGVEDEDIPLIPITPPKHRGTHQVPATTNNAYGLPTPPPTGSFPAISLSSFKPNNASFVQSGNAVVGTRPTSPRPNLFLASRTLSSLSLSPRSQALQQSKRKGLGGVAVKRITPPHSYFDQREWALESSEDVTARGMTVESDTKAIENSTQLVSLTASPPRFLLNFSSLPSSPASDCSSTCDLLSPSPLTSNSDTPPTSVPLTASRAASQSSNSSDIAKPLENNPFLPRPIPLVDVDTDVYAETSGIPGFEMNWRVPEWSFDAEELGNIELSFDDPSSMENSSGSPTERIGNEVEKELIEIEDENEKSDVQQEQVGESVWGWDGEPEEQENQDVEAHAEVCVEHIGQDLQEDEAMFNGQSECEGRGVVDDVELSVDYEVEEDIKYADPDLLPLPETIEVLPSIFTEADILPVISICTMLSKDIYNDDSDASSGSSLSNAASPISMVQTPTPPASPPREARVVSLLKPAIANDSDINRWTTTPAVSPKSDSFGPVDMELIKDGFRASSPPLADTEINSPDTDEADVSITVDSGVDEDKSHFFFEDKRFFCSPECTTHRLPVDGDDDEVDDELTLNVELASDVDCANDGHDYDETDMTFTTHVPYGVGDAPVESGDDKEKVLLCTEGRLNISAAKPSDCRTGQEEAVVDISEETRADGVVDAAEVSLEPEMNTHPVDKIPLDTTGIVQEEDAASSLSTPASEQPDTCLPGTFPDAKPSLKTDPVAEPQTAPPNLSAPPPSPRRRRSPLEEAIARTRSPLEVALAMQLRPGLGLGADPAWMVRFMMVMWGWMFGLVLVPGVEA